MKIDISINGQRREADVEPRLPLVHFIRDLVGLTGTHIGCETSFGQKIKRTEDPRLIQGIGHYVADIELAGTLSVAILRSPYVHAKINSIVSSRKKSIINVWRHARWSRAASWPNTSPASNNSISGRPRRFRTCHPIIEVLGKLSHGQRR